MVCPRHGSTMGWACDELVCMRCLIEREAPRPPGGEGPKIVRDPHGHLVLR